MIVRVAYSIIASITCIFTLLFFLDFQKRWKAAKIFQQAIHNAPLSMRHLFIAPEDLGVETWETGDYAVYELKTNAESKQISFHVTAQNLRSGKQHWLKTEGIAKVNGVDIDIWGLRSVKSLVLGGENAQIIFASGAIPFPIPPQRISSYPLFLQKVGKEKVETPIGTFKCQHYFAHVQSPDGNYEPLLELWANPSIRPLGIVRARWQDEVLELVQTQTQHLIEIPEMLSKTINIPLSRENKVNIQQATSVCTQCHQEDIGGKHLRLETLTLLSGVELELTHALYHHYTSTLAHPHKRLSFRLISHQGKRLTSEQIQFKWAKGSFQVKTNPTGQLDLWLDEIAHQGNVRVATRKGRLVLDTAAEFNP
ncbi:hypothetical protein C6503_17565 [Candidatus Poribacteria bacterium]|nr:MAG: hypothetical protein C6503_17565 [Candidatus Poribacteria bacterium]